MEYTTEAAPAQITLFTREKKSANSPLIKGWVWSDWVLAMTPDKRNNNFRSRTTEEHDRPGYKITKAELRRQFGDQNPCGIYEWMARDTNDIKKEYVVYIGSTCRGSAGNFIDRIYEYCTNGRHKEVLINSALEKRYELLVRYKGSGATVSQDHKRKAECDENTVLKYFDYAWNIRSAKQIARNLP